MTKEKIIKAIKENISNGKIEIAFELLFKLNLSPEMEAEAILIKSRYSSLKKKIRTGVIDNKDEDIVRNNIASSFLQLISVPDNRNFDVSKNLSKTNSIMINQSHSGKGDNITGNKIING